MKFTLDWLKAHLDTDADLGRIARTLTAIGLEVEAIEDRSAALAPFLVGHVVEAKQHPNADRLRVCLVDTGAGTVQVVCGAPNARTGMKGVFAPSGTTIPRTGAVLKASAIRGEASNGMLCSAYEMGLSDDHEGIIELPDDAPVGQPFAAAMGLDDPVIEIAITPNRPDCLGVRGVARDLAAAGLGRLKPRVVEPVPGRFRSAIAVAIDAPEACPLFLGRYIRGVRNGPSPEWLQRRLTAIGLRPISALVDITNFLTFDVNRPLHVFDAGKVKGGLRVHTAEGGETIEALNGKTYTLQPGMCAISDDSGVVSLGGVMGGATTGVSEGTTDLFLEAALFDALLTARTGRLLGIASDARYRFERGIDTAAVRDGIEAGTRLILELCGGEASEVVATGEAPDHRRRIAFRPGRVAALGGIDVEAGESRRILGDLGFELEPAPDGRLTAVPPSWRPDVEGEADLVEEVLRIRGFDHIPATPLPRATTVSRPALDPAQRRVAIARRVLAARGYDEAVTWSFLPAAQAKRFGGGQPELAVVNPISADLDQMRPSILPNLAAAARRNLDRGQAPVALFEVGPVYRTTAPDGQDWVAAALRTGSSPRHWRAPAREPDAMDAKADALAVLAQLGVAVDALAVAAEAPAWYHPGRSAVLKLGPKTVVARFGELHPGVMAEFGLDRPVAAFELMLDALPLPKAKSKARPRFDPPQFQAVTRDFAFVVAADMPADKLVRAAKSADKALVSAVGVFDVYAGAGLPEGTKSIALAVSLQPTDRTLTDAEIDAVGAKIVAAVAAATGGTLRG